ncbi:MAG: pseudouridine synthase, partial [Labilithrix sp.]|nr:pseudouridine synthase [Labilithrix sp.]
MERIQKILAHGGVSSRRAAEQLIKAGRVRVNGRVVTELGAKADPRRDRVEVDGKRVVAEELVYVVLHKPRGVVSTMSDPEGRPTVKELLASLGARVYPVGRLDFATSGVLLATNDGELADGLLHPRKTVPKTYVLKVKGSMKPDDVARWEKGVRLEDGMTLPATAKLLRHETDKTWLELTIREGRNQQIRRMGEATGFPVMRLARVAFAEISAEGLAPGRWRHLTRDELIALKKTYGVPRSIPSAASIPRSPSKDKQRSVPTARRGAASRAQRAFGAEDRRGEENWGTPRPRNDERPRDGAGRVGRPRGDERPRDGAGRVGRPRGDERPRDGAGRAGRPRGDERPRNDERPRATGGRPRGGERPRAT